MCRILAISSAGRIPEGFARSFRRLAKTGNTIHGTYEETVKQGRTPGHRGGWGLVASRNGEWLGMPTISQVDKDQGFGDASENRSGYTEVIDSLDLAGPGVLIVHLRRPSSGDICNLNTHPFAKEGYVFAHNGGVPWLTEEDKEAGALSQRNDSRALFQRILIAISERESVENALASIVSAVHQDVRNKARPYSSLTSVLSDGRTLWVIRDVNPRKGTAAGRYYTMFLSTSTDAPAVPLACQEMFSDVVAPGEWTPMRDSELAVIRDGVIIERRPLSR